MRIYRSLQSDFLKHAGCLRFQPRSGHGCDRRCAGEHNNSYHRAPISSRTTPAGEATFIPTVYCGRETYTSTTVRAFPGIPDSFGTNWVPPSEFCISAAGYLPSGPIRTPLFTPSYSTPTLHILGRTDVVVVEERSNKLLEVSANQRVEYHPGGTYASVWTGLVIY